MGLLKPVNAPSHLKAGFFGFAGSGKTYTATMLAIGARKHFGLEGPIVFFDTEGGAGSVCKALEKELEGTEVLAFEGRSFDDLMKVTSELFEVGCSVFIVDSITHVWRELCDAYMKKVNAMRVSKRLPPRAKMALPDIMRVKSIWAAWPDWFLTSPIHAIICGRAGFEWDKILDERTGELELTKTGTKMKVESEFGFEAGLLVEMQKIQKEVHAEGLIPHHAIDNLAIILKDRFDTMMGQTCMNPEFSFFLPHVECLTGKQISHVDTSVKSDPNVDDQGDSDWYQEKRTRKIIIEELDGILMSALPGQTKAEKKQRVDLVKEHFGTHSRTSLADTPSYDLRRSLEALKAALKDGGMQ